MSAATRLQDAARDAQRTILGDIEWTATQFRTFMHMTQTLCSRATEATQYIEELEKERDAGYEFLRRWQEWATATMRKLGEVDEQTLPDDTRTRKVVSDKLEAEEDLRALLKKVLPLVTQDAELSFQERSAAVAEAMRLGCLEDHHV